MDDSVTTAMCYQPSLSCFMQSTKNEPSMNMKHRYRCWFHYHTEKTVQLCTIKVEAFSIPCRAVSRSQANTFTQYSRQSPVSVINYNHLWLRPPPTVIVYMYRIIIQHPCTINDCNAENAVDLPVNYLVGKLSVLYASQFIYDVLIILFPPGIKLKWWMQSCWDEIGNECSHPGLIINQAWSMMMMMMITVARVFRTVSSGIG